MRVLADQAATAERQLAYPDHVMYLVWGAVYALGYLPLALSRGEWAVVDLPLGVALGTFFACLITGIGLSIWIGSRFARGLRGVGARQGLLYGLSWWLAFLGVAGVSSRLSQMGVEGDDMGLLINGVSMLLVGVLFMAGGVVWSDRTQFTIGAAVCGATTIALVAGLPVYYWVMSVLVGGGLFLVGLVLAVRHPPRQQGTRT